MSGSIILRNMATGFLFCRYIWESVNMDFGRIKEFESVDYSLPPDHKSVAKVLGGAASDQRQLFAGGVLWSDDTFKGTIYPEKAKPQEFVKYYCRQFNPIELNTTHYRVPDADT